MKKAVTFLFIILLLTLDVFSQEESPSHEDSISGEKTEKLKKEKTVSILTNPLLLFSDAFISDYSDYDMENTSSYLYMVDIETQIKLSNYSNLSLSVSFLFGENSYSSYNNYSYNDDVFQICFKPMFIHRPFGTGLRGFYLGFYPHFTYTVVNNIYDEITEYYEMGAGIALGYKWIFKSGLSLQTGFSIGKTFPLNGKRYSDQQIYADGRIRIQTTDIQLFEFKIGYSF